MSDFAIKLIVLFSASFVFGLASAYLVAVVLN